MAVGARRTTAAPRWCGATGAGAARAAGWSTAARRGHVGGPTTRRRAARRTPGRGPRRRGRRWPARGSRRRHRRRRSRGAPPRRGARRARAAGRDVDAATRRPLPTAASQTRLSTSSLASSSGRCSSRGCRRVDQPAGPGDVTALQPQHGGLGASGRSSPRRGARLAPGGSGGHPVAVTELAGAVVAQRADHGLGLGQVGAAAPMRSASSVIVVAPDEVALGEGEHRPAGPGEERRPARCRLVDAVGVQLQEGEVASRRGQVEALEGSPAAPPAAGAAARRGCGGGRAGAALPDAGRHPRFARVHGLHRRSPGGSTSAIRGDHPRVWSGCRARFASSWARP